MDRTHGSLSAMTDSTPSPESDPERATLSEPAMESVRAAANALEHAYESERLSIEACTLAIEMGDPRPQKGPRLRSTMPGSASRRRFELLR